MKIFYADLHLFGIDPIKEGLEFGENIYYLGDIVDVRNSLKSKIFEAQELIAEIEKNAGEHYISGNQELNSHNIQHITKDGILLSHGDILCCGYKSAKNQRKYKAGKGKIWRWFQGFFGKYERKEGIGHNVGRTKFKKACYKAAKESGCHTVVVGHRHPKKLQKEVYQGITIYVLPRGKTIIEDI